MEFPFRRETFIVTSNKAKVLLNFQPKHSIAKDIPAELKDYEAQGGLKEDWGMEELRYDCEIMASKDPKFMFTYPFFDDEGVNPEAKPYPFESAAKITPSINNK